MNHQERLFLAIGEADPKLVARSEQRKRNHWLSCGIAIAACLTLVLTLGRILPPQIGPAVTSPDSQGPAITVPNLTENQGPNSGGQLSLPEQGNEIGTLRLLSYTPESQSKAVDFLIYVNEEQFAVQESNGLYYIRSTHSLPENFPECGMDIAHFSDTSPSQVKAAAEAALKEHYPEMSSEELAAALPGSLYLRASESLDEGSGEPEFWKAEQTELWFVDDGQGGTFTIISRYFLEAEEGLGACFRDMVSSFRVVDLNETVPDWMRELYATVDRLSRALLSDDLSEVSDLLTTETTADAYDENVWPDTTIISVDYSLDDDQNPAKAVVSVKHRLNLTEGDSFNFLTMELVHRSGNWYLNWSGIEK